MTEKLYNSNNGPWSSVFRTIFCVVVFILDIGSATAVRKILDARNVTVCRQPLYYNADTLYIIRAQNKIYSSKCEIKFLDWNDAIVGQPCVSLCVRVHNNSMTSCDFEMTYYDGLGDINAKSFDCHSFPPVLWCSRKNEIKIAFTELKKYKGAGYDITLEVTSYCSHDDDSTDNTSEERKPGDSYFESKRKEEKRTRDTVIIAGSLVSTVSFILVICWVTYCCWKRKHPFDQSSSNTPHTAGSATSSSTPKSEGSSQRPCQYSACAATTTNTKQFYQPPGRQYLQQKPSNLYSNSYNYPPRPNADRYVQFPDSAIDMKHSFVQYKNQPQSCLRDTGYREDYHLGVDFGEGGHSYDADEDSPEKDITPPVPPRPNLTQQSKQYFI